MEILWQGYGGLGVQDVKGKLTLLRRSIDDPDILLLHCGGNDLGRLSLGDLRQSVISLLRYLHKTLPDTKLIFSQILPRLQYRYSTNIEAMERCRKRVNSAAGREVLRLGGCYLKYPDITLSEIFFLLDRVHLSELGSCIFLNTLQGGLEYFISGKGQVYPI